MTKKPADLKLSIPLDAIDLDRVIAFCVRAFVVGAEEVIHVENDHPNPDGFGVYALYWGEMQHIADRKSPEEAEEVCADLRDILAEHYAQFHQKEACMPKISPLHDHDLAISKEELEALDIQKFEVSPWAYDDPEYETTIILVDNLEDADGVGVYARLTNGLTVHVKDFNIDAELGLEEAQEAQEDAVQLADTLNAYLPGSEPVFDEHLEAMYEDRVSGMDFDWEY